MNSSQFVNLPEMAEIRNDLRKPINSTEREKRISGKPQSKLYPYYGATGQVGVIDSYLSDGEYVLVGEDGAPFLDITKSKAYLISGKGWVNNHAHVLQAREKKSTNRFLLHYLNYFNYKDFVSGTTRLKLTKGKLEQIPIPNFSFDEQVKIAHRIDNLFNKVDRASKELESTEVLLSTYKQSILNSAIRGKLVPQNPKDEPASKLLEKIQKEKEKLIAEKKIKKEKPLNPISEDEIPFKIPLGWEWVRLNDLVSHLGDGLHGTPEYNEYGEYYFINGNNLSDGEILIKENTKRVDQREYTKHKKPLTDRSILVSINGTLGNVAFFNDEKVILGKSACYFNLLNDINKDYIRTLLESPYFQNYAAMVATGSTIKNVPLSGMRMLPVPVPPISEQLKISLKVREAISQMAKASTVLKDNLIKAAQLKQSILKKAFEGEL